MFRMPAIVVIGLGAKSGNLKVVFSHDDHNDPKLSSDRNGVPEEFLNLLRESGGRDVVVAGAAVQEEVAHAAPDPEGGKTGCLEPPHDAGGMVTQRIGRLFGHGAGSFVSPYPLHMLDAAFGLLDGDPGAEFEDLDMGRADQGLERTKINRA